MLFAIKIQRKMPRRPRTSVQEQLDFFVQQIEKFKNPKKTGWLFNSSDYNEHQVNNEWIFTAFLTFENKRTNKEAEWEEIVNFIQKIGDSNKFNIYPWKLITEKIDPSPQFYEIEEQEAKEVTTKDTIPGVHSMLPPEGAKTIEDLKELFPHELLKPAKESDRLIENHPAFKGIYDRGPQIRTCLSAIQNFIISDGKKANHVLLYGLPACAKTQILLGIEKLFGPGSVLKLDSTSTTRAGLERLIFSELEFIPPLIFMEEIEKANEEALRIWLGAMDDRHEFRKVSYRTVSIREVRFLGMATANDKLKFDLMMGGRPSDPGALSSRFMHQLECPRPNEHMLRRILLRDIPKIDGKKEWIEPCIELAKKLKTNDPRRVLAFLDGRDRLLTGEYQNDILNIYQNPEKP